MLKKVKLVNIFVFYVKWRVSDCITNLFNINFQTAGLWLQQQCIFVTTTLLLLFQEDFFLLGATGWVQPGYKIQIFKVVVRIPACQQPTLRWKQAQS